MRAVGSSPRVRWTRSTCLLVAGRTWVLGSRARTAVGGTSSARRRWSVPSSVRRLPPGVKVLLSAGSRRAAGALRVGCRFGPLSVAGVRDLTTGGPPGQPAGADGKSGPRRTRRAHLEEPSVATARPVRARRREDVSSRSNKAAVGTTAEATAEEGQAGERPVQLFVDRCNSSPVSELPFARESTAQRQVDWSSAASRRCAVSRHCAASRR